MNLTIPTPNQSQIFVPNLVKASFTISPSALECIGTSQRNDIYVERRSERGCFFCWWHSTQQYHFPSLLARRATDNLIGGKDELIPIVVFRIVCHVSPRIVEAGSIFQKDCK